MGYEYAGTLYDTESKRAAAQVLDYIWPRMADLEEAVSNAISCGDAATVKAEMDEHDWSVDYPDEDFEDIWNEALGQLVWSVRDALDMSQAELGEALGYDHRHIGRMEDGDRPVKPVVLRALLQMLEAQNG